MRTLIDLSALSISPLTQASCRHRVSAMVVTCQSATEARAAIDAALRILSELSVQLHAQKTRVVHVRHRFEFLGQARTAATTADEQDRCRCQVGRLVYLSPRE